MRLSIDDRLPDEVFALIFAVLGPALPLSFLETDGRAEPLTRGIG